MAGTNKSPELTIIIFNPKLSAKKPIKIGTKTITIETERDLIDVIVALILFGIKLWKKGVEIGTKNKNEE